MYVCCIFVYMALEGASLVSGMVKKNLPAIQETQVQSLGCEDPLEKVMALVEKGIPGKRP